MTSPSESQPLLSNGQLPTSSGTAQNGESVGSATETPSKPFSQRLRRMLDNLQHSCFGGLRSSCASPTSETYLGIALCAGIVCGGVAFLYSSAFEALLDLVWTKVPENLVLPALERLHKAHSWWPAPGIIGAAMLLLLQRQAPEHLPHCMPSSVGLSHAVSNRLRFVTVSCVETTTWLAVDCCRVGVHSGGINAHGHAGRDRAGRHGLSRCSQRVPTRQPQFS